MSRRPFDFYATPERATEILIELCPEVLGKPDTIIWEPCNGDGAISDIIKRHRHVITSDIDPARQAFFTADAKTLEYGRETHVITNPPFNEAIEIVSNTVCQVGACAFLLRLTFLELTAIRGDWLAVNPPAGTIVLPRISFTGDGKTDSVTCVWQLWNVEPFGTIIVPKSVFRQEVANV